MSFSALLIGLLVVLWLSPALLLLALYLSNIQKWPIPGAVDRLALTVLSSLSCWLRPGQPPSRGHLRLEAERRVALQRNEGTGKFHTQPVLSSLAPVVTAPSGVVDEHNPTAPSFMHLEAVLIAPDRQDVRGEHWQIGVN
ncbi:MAG: hypothetical protein GVY12_03865 [Bacteroidetes bacterium]|jgi:hypothetical protein|nr:hypothetical protein [Bacteroidota bacterium]